MTRRPLSDVTVALLLAVGLIVVYNANGREIGSYDSLPNKLSARELLLRGTLSLNHVVGAVPALADRPAFVVDVNGRYRSAYSPLPSIFAAGLAWPLAKTGLLDLTAPRAPNVIAVLGASILTTLAVVLGYLAARQRVSRVRALLLALGLGLGTGLWSTVSQTLWVHETTILGVAIAVLAFARPEARMTLRASVVVGLGLGLAGMARPQVAPLVGVLLGGMFLRSRFRDACVCCAIVAACAALLVMLNLRWFGHALGPIASMEATNSALHGTSGSFQLSLDGFIGLLASPNRGLLVFSPVVLLAFGGVRAAVVEGWQSPLRWCALAAVAQYALYSSYSVWWAGHTYGPRYLLDVLPLLVPLAAATLARTRATMLTRSLGAAALAWSIVVAGTGAFCYPNDAWNTDPTEVDRDHARLWSWSDMQIVRCWQRGPRPQNFNLFDRDAFSSGARK